MTACASAATCAGLITYVLRDSCAGSAGSAGSSCARAGAASRSALRRPSVREVRTTAHGRRERWIEATSFPGPASLDPAAASAMATSPITGHGRRFPIPSPSFRMVVHLLQPNDTIGPYRIERRLAVGGMGRLYLADRGGTRVVLKLLRDTVAEDEEFRAMF